MQMVIAFKQNRISAIRLVLVRIQFAASLYLKILLWLHLCLFYFILIGSFAPDLPYKRGVRYAYRYSTTISTAFQGSSSGRNGLALDCVVDIELVSKCHLMLQVSRFDFKKKVFLTIYKYVEYKIFMQTLFPSD